MCFLVNFAKFLRAPSSQNTSSRLLLIMGLHSQQLKKEATDEEFVNLLSANLTK